MSEQNIDNGRQELGRLARRGDSARGEVSVVVSPGERAGCRAVKVKANVSYNVYSVRDVTIGEPGTLPVEIGNETEAVNVAEDFLQAGQLATGTYVLMHRLGDKNVFYAPL